jgi:hypothetical protein
MAELVDVLAAFDTDKRKQREGVWTEIELAEDVKLEVKIATSRTLAYQAKMLDLLAPYKETLGEGESISDEKSDEISSRALAGTVLTDWRGLMYDGREIPFKEETAVLLLQEVPDLRIRIETEARDKEKYRFDSVEAVAERLGKTLSGNSSGGKRSGRKPSKTESGEE